MKYFEEQVKFVKEMNEKKNDIKFRYTIRQITLEERTELLIVLDEEKKMMEKITGKFNMDEINSYIEKEKRNESIKNISKKTVKTTSTTSSIYGMIPSTITRKAGRIAMNAVKAYPGTSLVIGCGMTAVTVYSLYRKNKK